MSRRCRGRRPTIAAVNERLARIRETMSAEEYRAATAAPSRGRSPSLVQDGPPAPGEAPPLYQTGLRPGAKPLKYGNTITAVDGIKFRSKLEAKRYSELKILADCRAIDRLRLQPRYKLEVNGVPICTMVADFEYWERGRRVIEDAKGYETRYGKLVLRLFEALEGVKVNLVRK